MNKTIKTIILGTSLIGFQIGNINKYKSNIEINKTDTQSKVEYILNGNNTSLKNKKLIFTNATVTTYNPTKGQTDDTPCINHTTEKKLKNIFGTGNLCELQEMGINTVAVTQDRLKYVYKILKKEIPEGKILFDPGDKIEITEAGECNGIYYVADALNKRYNSKEHIDIFKNNKNHNTKCTGAKVTLMKK